MGGNYWGLEFGVHRFAEEMGFSRRQLHRKITALTGRAPSEIVRRFRLERALHLLEKRSGTVSEIAYAVGFVNPSHFATAFRETFGHPPTDYLALI